MFRLYPCILLMFPRLMVLDVPMCLGRLRYLCHFDYDLSLPRATSRLGSGMWIERISTPSELQTSAQPGSDLHVRFCSFSSLLDTYFAMYVVVTPVVIH
ncbi:hypothetical protein BDW74DRAFT_162497, partial [Aspergillus multicolor]|uniref:uncharacterized protein n=1 Tax=Aspergillus multicolor TaxID=41759 RepID=UPI003CCDF724